MSLEFIYNDIVLTVVLSLLLVGGTLLPTDEFKRFNIAKACWYLLACYLCGRVLMWSVLTPERFSVRAVWVFLAFGIIAVVCTEMVRAIGIREKEATRVSEQEPPKPPPVQQNSQGNNSPNTAIIGNNNTVINNSDPKVSAKLDEIKKLLQAQQGDKATPDKLLKKYPLGYAIFDFDKSNRVFPYATEALLRRWGFDWSSVAVSERKIDGQDAIFVTLPNISVGKSSFKSIGVGGLKKVGPLDGIALRTDDFDLRIEILAISPKGIVFLLGFDSPPQN